MLKAILDMFLQKSLENLAIFLKQIKLIVTPMYHGYKERLECFSPGGALAKKLADIHIVYYK